MFQGKTLVLGVSGGIAVYKVPELISRLRQRGLTVEVVMTSAAAEFVTPLTFREVSQNQVHQAMFNDPFQWQVAHIALAQKADLCAIIPATANIIAKLAHGIGDDLLTTTILAATGPRLIAPAMNQAMWQNQILQQNLAILVENGFTVVGPDQGHLLCGNSGMGRLAALAELEKNIERLLTTPDLAGQVVLVTAGGTREPLDPVRYLGNRSSGRMGHALAEAAWCRGARVLLVTTAPELAPPCREIELFTVETTAQMRESVLELAPQASLIIKAAAPLDFRPSEYASSKIKKATTTLEIKLKLNPDILTELGQTKRPGQLLVGFAAETDDLAVNARAKLKAKRADLIVANLVNQPETGMGAELNEVTVYSAKQAIAIPRLTKRVLADRILDLVQEYRKTRIVETK